MQTVTVTADEANMRVDRFLEARFPGLSYSHIQRIVRKGELRVDGKRADSKDRLKAGQAVRIPPLHLDAPKKSSGLSEAEQKTLAALKEMTLFEDDDVLVLNKPAGLAVQGGSGTTQHVDRMLEVMRDSKGQKPRLVHRLDKETSGCLLVAKTRFAASQLTGSFRSRSARKIYWAMVAGVPKPKQGRISTYPRQGRARGRFVHAHRRAWRRRRKPRGDLLRGGGDGGAEARLGVAEAGDRPHASAARAYGAYRPSDRRRSEIFRRSRTGNCRAASRTACICWRAGS